MEENQRARLLVGIVRAVSANGYNEATITQIAEAAAVSRHTFYDNFENKEEAFLAAFDLALDGVSTAMREAAEQVEEWPEKAKARLQALLAFFAPEPELSRFFWLEPSGGGEAIVDRYRSAMHELIGQVTVDRPEQADVPPLSGIAEEAMVGGVVSLIVKQVNSGGASELESLLPDLLVLTLAPFVGSAEAERVAR